jgi:glycosyltransferase involved in cell wall biosynthesis
MSGTSKTLLLAANSSWNLLNFRMPIIAASLEAGYRVAVAVPPSRNTSAFRDLGVEVHFVPIDARGLSPVRDLGLFLAYLRLMRRLEPAAFIPFTIKPNIYGSVAAHCHRVPTFNTITGLGTGFLSGRAVQIAAEIAYRLALRRSDRVFFHNADDRQLFISRRLVSARQAALVGGSGVDLVRFSPRQRPGSAVPTFLFVGRFLKDKGAREFAEAALEVTKLRSVRCRMLGGTEDHPKAVPLADLEQFAAAGAVEILRPTDDVRPFIAEADCIVLPSYREGLPRVLLEASAMGKPVIASNVPGCRQAVEQGITGLLCEARSSASLAAAMMAFLDLPPTDRQSMGALGRAKAEREFSDGKVAEVYLKALRTSGI